MQSEEIDDSRLSSKETSPDAEDMTIDIDLDPASTKLQQCNSQFSSDTDYSFDRVKLESYIEKIIPNSPESSDTIEEDSKLKEIISKIPGSSQDDINQADPFRNLQEQNSNESIRSWLQRITQMQNEIQKKINLDSANAANKIIPKQNRVVTYDDLPYMGEMTLDNSKPRRGRKPKKADICHLIYKNYGTIFPGAPDTSKDLIDEPSTKKKSSKSSPHTKSNVQNKIISSLLEKRLTQETKKCETQNKLPKFAQNQDEPLNLCIRDLNQLKIRLLRKHSNTYISESTPEIKLEPQSDDEVEFVNETSSLSSPDIPNLSPSDFPTDVQNEKNPENKSAPGGYIYWPNAGVFIHPVALQQQLLYYQKMAANNNYTVPSPSPRPPPDSPTSPIKTPTELRKLAPKIRPKKDAEEQEHEPKQKRNATTSSDKTPVKRKRSAIFIPPIPSENQTNPATEVSICKFKFTGGAKPSLQEKKMLSVDSGGNFRYYSGTGDKSMRGYEFFPREALQQQVESAHGSSTGAFLQASGEKIFPPPVDFTGKQSNPDFLLSPDLSNSNLSVDINSRHKKRKSRKSLQREKLEQTFKEKGFLIQTQQLESAEGATYCKFRQLRKFTRYLFRSWKDYLPGNVRELNEEEEEGEPDLENLCAVSGNEENPNQSGPF